MHRLSGLRLGLATLRQRGRAIAKPAAVATATAATATAATIAVCEAAQPVPPFKV